MADILIDLYTVFPRTALYDFVVLIKTKTVIISRKINYWIYSLARLIYSSSKLSIEFNCHA